MRRKWNGKKFDLLSNMKYLKTFENFSGIDHNKLWWNLGLTAGKGTMKSELFDEEEIPTEDKREDESDLPDLEDEQSEKEL